MTHSDSIAHLAGALTKAQGALASALKDARNPHFQSRYATLASMVEACRAALAANELSVIQSPSADGNLVSMITMLLHSSGEWIASDALHVQARDAGPQAVGSCLTYLRRYQLAAVVGIAPDDDDDGEAGEARGAGAKTPTVVAKQNVPSRHDVQVLQVQSQATNNPRVTRYLVTFSSGASAHCVNAPLAEAARAYQESGERVDADIRPGRYGDELIGIVLSLAPSDLAPTTVPNTESVF